MDDYFHGHDVRDCGEHQTVGTHKAWCFECSEWCYPQLTAGCKGCRIPCFRAEIERITNERDFYANMQAGRETFTEEKQLQLDRSELARALVSYEVFRWSAMKQSAEDTLAAIEKILCDAVDQEQPEPEGAEQ